MKNIEFLKLLCISNGYHRNIEIETWKDDCGETLYSVYAENDKLLSVHSSCGLFADAIHDIVTEISNNAYFLKMNPNYEKESEEAGENTIILTECEDYPYIDGFPWCLNHLPNKYLLNDEYRNLVIEKQDKLNKLRKHEQEFERNLHKYPIKPCIYCNEKVPTEIPYNEECELHYNMSCPKLRKWMDEDIPNYHKEYNQMEEVKHINQKIENIHYIYDKKLKEIKI